MQEHHADTRVLIRCDERRDKPILSSSGNLPFHLAPVIEDHGDLIVIALAKGIWLRDLLDRGEFLEL